LRLKLGEVVGIGQFRRAACPYRGGDIAQMAELAGAVNLSVAREDLLDQGSARARKADDEDGQRRGRALARQLRQKLGREYPAKPGEARGGGGLVIGEERAPQTIARKVVRECIVVSAKILIGLTERHVQEAAFDPA